MAGDHKTFQLRYVGDRFEDARLPVDVLSDLPAFRDLLVAYAKKAWRAQNADRQRLPRNFDKSISFDLVALDKGSAVPTLDWDRKTAQVTLPGFADDLDILVDQSYVRLVEMIDNAGRDRFPLAMSSEQIRALNKLGAGLRDHERIEFLGSRGADANVVYLDTYRRKKLITHARDTYQARFEGIGRLLGCHVDETQTQGFIDVQTIEHGGIKIPLEPDRIVNEFDGNLGSDVQFVLQIELDNNDVFRSIIDVFDVEVTAQIGPEIMKCRARLEELNALADGWHDGAGAATSAAAMNAASDFLTKTGSLAAAYRIYPTGGGGVLFEFESNGWDLSVEFRSGGAVEIYGVDIHGDDELEPQEFPRLNDEFYDIFNNRVGR